MKLYMVYCISQTLDDREIQGSISYESRALICVSDDAMYRIQTGLGDHSLKTPGRVNHCSFSMFLNKILQKLQNVK